MDLSELKKQLYKKDGHFENRPKPPEEFAPGHTPPPPALAEPQWSEQQEQDDFYLSSKRKRIFWLMLVGVVVALTALGGWIFWRSWHSFDASGVSLEVFGQNRVVSGEEINYIVRYKNNSKVAIDNVVLNFNFSAQATPADKSDIIWRGDSFVAIKSLGRLLPGQEGQAEFKARVLGDKDSQQKFSAKLTYRPSNFNSDFSNAKEFVSTIISVPLVLSFILPEKIVSGQTVNFSLRYLNTSDTAFSDAKLKIEYPADFIFDSALPSPSAENNIWDLAEIGSREEGSIMIKGVISGNEGEAKVFKAQIGLQKSDEDFIVYSQTLSSPQISASPLFVEQTLISAPDNNVNLGQNLIYKLKYRNTTDVTIGPVFIMVKIDSQAVDLASVNAVGGFFSSSDGLATWNSSSLPSLESLGPGVEGTLEFSFRVKNRLSIKTFSDKNFTITTTAKIDSLNVPLALSGTQLAGQSQLSVKVNSPLTISMKGYHQDSLLPNFGPLPPLVGQKTTYTIYWQVLDNSNDLSGTIVEAYLPSYLSWEGRTYPGNEDIRYDVASGKATWRLGRLPAGAGTLSPVKQVAFQVGFVPSIGQVGNTAVIIKEVKALAQDDFTGVQISASKDQLQSDMPDDPTMSFEKGRVRN